MIRFTLPASPSRFRTIKQQEPLPGGSRKSGGVPKAVPAAKAVKATGLIPETTELDEAGSKQTSVSRSHRIRSPEELTAYFKIDTQIWEQERIKTNNWEVGANVDGTIIVEPLFQITIFWRRRQNVSAAIDAAQVFKDLVASYSGPKKLVSPPKKKSGAKNYMLEVGCSSDLHIGKRCNPQETRDAEYNLEIAADLYRKAVDKTLGKAPVDDVEQVLVVLGSDQFHVDSRANMTTGGTPQDVAGSYSEIYRLGCQLSIETIDKALGIAPVVMRIVGGNHDNTTSWHLGEFLSSWYRGNKYVVIDNQPTERKYHQFHRCLLGLYHGSQRKVLKQLGKIMTNECRSIWSEIEHCEWHTNHVHHQTVLEDVNCVIRTLSALCPADKWHSDMAYVGAKQAAQGFLWHRDDGLEDIFNFNVRR